MAITSRTNLKAYFETGDKPTQQQFVDLIDSFVHQTDNDTPITDTLQISGSDTYTSGSTSMLLGAAITGSILTGDSSSDLGAPNNAWKDLYVDKLNVFTSSNFQGDLTISGNLIPIPDTDSFTSSFSLGSPEAAWKDLFVSEDSIKFIKKSGSGESEELARITIDTGSGRMKLLGETDHKDLELRQTQFGKNPTKGVTINDGGGDLSTFVAVSLKHREEGIPGGHILLRPESFALQYLGDEYVAHAM